MDTFALAASLAKRYCEILDTIAEGGPAPPDDADPFRELEGALEKVAVDAGYQEMTALSESVAQAYRAAHDLLAALYHMDAARSELDLVKRTPAPSNPELNSIGTLLFHTADHRVRHCATEVHRTVRNFLVAVAQLESDTAES